MIYRHDGFLCDWGHAVSCGYDASYATFLQTLGRNPQKSDKSYAANTHLSVKGSVSVQCFTYNNRTKVYVRTEQKFMSVYEHLSSLS